MQEPIPEVATVNPVDLSLIDFLVLRRANLEGVYGYALRHEYEFAGKEFSAGSVYRQLGRLAEQGCLSRNQVKEVAVKGPPRRMFFITEAGQKVLEDAKPIFRRILGVQEIDAE